ncbi:hypothetical protein IGS68_31580 (plasmid) [Skermanella sp. TT6]|uniref:RNA polymerase sigma factor 70 region 4 type 2 domain-containing protein n=1 Tax=Skermanella cutis TaxID=2775420 RepID=A0ABX7BF14_9PROT|nr:sigma factor-like helix-turn-helix DNA-binding protein [Skermanella sp. TT6]QQP92976.1 hypothetical protein IGS68_31580 [Skermanella sp. TT6]
MKTSYLPSTLAQVRREVEALPAEGRSALMLVCVQGLSYQEAARQLDIPLQAVRKHLLGARLALLRKLDQPAARRLDRIAHAEVHAPTS